MQKKRHLPLVASLVALLAVSLACSFSVSASTPVIIVVTATQAAAQAQPTEPIEPSATIPAPSATIPAATNTPADTATPEVQRFFTEEFDGDLDNWTHFITSGDESDLDFYASNSRLSFDIKGTNVWAYALYDPMTYDNVRIDVSTANRGNNDNYITLLCRYDVKKGWYEFNVTNSGLYHIYFGQWNPGQETASYATLYDGGSNAIHTGTTVNEISAVCDGNTLALFINGTKVRSVSSEFGLQSGQVGIGVSSFNIPVAVDFDWVKLSEP